MSTELEDPRMEQVVDQLADADSPILIGVRHHSAALSKVMPALLDAAAPEKILLELPPEFETWLPWLAHEETEAPIALAGCGSRPEELFFYPFADFSPELVAVRWAFKQGVPVECIDLPVAARFARYSSDERQERPLLRGVLRRMQCRDSGELWDRLIEAVAPISSAEQLRRAGLLFGWMMRWNSGEVSQYDLAREEFMRARMEANRDQRCVAVIGAFHAAALMPEPLLWQPPEGRDEEKSDDKEIATAVIPYGFDQLDERSGYPAGVKDPTWQQAVYEARSLQELDASLARLIVGVCREMREQGFPMNAADGIEVVRMSRDLARLRKLPVSGRAEVVEAIQMCLTQGQLHGAGRAVAKAMQAVLVGDRSGALPGDLPRCGLAPDIEEIFKQLNLPGPESLGEEKRMRLDALRSRLDRSRKVTFERLNTCGIPYATAVADGGFGRESLTENWDLKWQNSTAAMVNLSSAKGATLQQAARGTILQELTGPMDEWGEAQLAAVIQAGNCGFPELVQRGIEWIAGPFSMKATLGELTTAMQLLDRLHSGHIPGLPKADDEFDPAFCQSFDLPEAINASMLLQSAISRVDGLVGSEEFADVAALLELILWFQQQDDDQQSLEGGRLIWTLQNLKKQGSALMQGAGTGALFVLDVIPAEEFQEITGSWIDAATTADSRKQLIERMRGALYVAGPRIQADLSCLGGIDTRLQHLTDGEFLARAPALRGGFDVLSPRNRTQLLKELEHLYPDAKRRTVSTDFDPEQQKLWFESDQAARDALLELMPHLDLSQQVDEANEETQRVLDESANQLSQLDRWRLVLGQKSDSMCAQARAAARCLDELYGQGSGEGARCDLGGDRGGSEDPFPNVREWADELGELFGERVREEVLGKAVEQGRGAALTVLNEDTLSPSVELLEQVLSMKGGLPDSQTDKLRRLAKRITDELSKELATRLAPALMGLSTPRPTRRPSPRLDLRRTVMANLHTARKTEDGRTQLVPEDFFFKTPVKKSMDWHIIYVVDVSGSMEASVIYSALTAAIFAGLPAISVSFLAFSTQVMDFTGKVDDPLEMLLEVQVGGGTFIYRGLQAAREKLQVPSRTIVILITDFEEGGPVSAMLDEVRTLVDSGAKVLGLAALSDDGKPRYNTGIASQVVSCGMPVAALSPQELARWVGEQIQ